MKGFCFTEGYDGWVRDPFEVMDSVLADIGEEFIREFGVVDEY